MQNTLSDDQLARLNRLLVGVTNVFLGQPVVIDDNLIVTTHDIAAGGMAIAAQPDVPRNLTFVLTDADDSVTATITIDGKDIQGRPVQEVAQITLGTGKAWTGTKIFAQVDSIIVSTLSGEAAGDAIIVGIGNVIGLPNDINDEQEVLRIYVGAGEVTADAIATGESTSGIDANGATYDGSKIMYATVQSAAQA